MKHSPTSPANTGSLWNFCSAAIGFRGAAGLYEGQRLVVRCRTVLGFTDKLVNARGIDFVLRRTGQTLTGLSAVHLRLNDSGEWIRTAETEALDVCRERGVGMFALVHARGEDGQAHKEFGAFLTTKKRWQAFYAALKEIVRIPDVFAVYVDVGPIRFGDGARFLRWIVGAAEIVRAAGLKLYVGIPVFRPGVRGRLGAAELDARQLARHAHGLVLQGHWPTTWGDPASFAVHIAAQFAAPLPAGAKLEDCIGHAARCTSNTMEQARLSGRFRISKGWHWHTLSGKSLRGMTRRRSSRALGRMPKPGR